MARVEDRDDIAEVLLQQASHTTGTPSSAMTSFFAEITADHTTADHMPAEVIGSVQPATQPLATKPDDTVIPVELFSQLPLSTSYPTSLRSQSLPSTTCIHSYPLASTLLSLPIPSQFPYFTPLPTSVSSHSFPSTLPVLSHIVFSTSLPTVLSHAPSSFSASTSLSSQNQSSTSPTTPGYFQPPVPVPPDTTSVLTKQSSNQPTNSGGRSFEVCS